jgi:hypothetical protein
MGVVFFALIGLAVRQKRTAADRTNENIGIQSAPHKKKACINYTFKNEISQVGGQMQKNMLQ